MDEEMAKPLDRETLYEEVWTDPVTVVSQRYGLSDVGLAKICRRLRIPLPSRGYWAKIKAGKTMHRVALPKLAEEVTSGVGLVKLTSEQSARRAASREQTVKARQSIQPVMVSGELTDSHPLVLAASRRLNQRDGWTNEKGLRSAPGEVLHLEVTPSALDRALRLMDALLKELAKFSVTVQVDVKQKRTVLDVEGTIVTLMISEYVRRAAHEETPEEKKAMERYRNSWHSGPRVSYPSIPQYDFHPTGMLTITAGNWPSRNWRDTLRTRLEDRLAEVVVGVLALAKVIHEKKLEEARKEEERKRAQARYEFLKGRLEKEQECFKKLEQEAVSWERAARLRAYVDAVARRADSTGEWSSELQEWVAWARAKADWLDPMILVSDPILDAPEPRKPGYY